MMTWNTKHTINTRIWRCNISADFLISLGSETTQRETWIELILRWCGGGELCATIVNFTLRDLLGVYGDCIS
jgi:hypothetical protein